MKSKIPAINLLIIIIISIFLIFIFISCAPTVTEKIDVNKEESESETGGISEKEIEELEETVEVVDYENAQIGAEIKGYIPSFLCTDIDNYIKIEITNTSDFTWISSGEDMVRIGYHYYGQDVGDNNYDNPARTSLPNNLKPGESATIEVLIIGITNKGIYVLQIDPVLEGHFWFSSKGIPMLEGRTYFGSCTDQSESE